ncbi:SH3 domain-containing protein [Paracoccus onubensis]|uniref:SH3 domain-containing protein n=1 Tax=Paracoccus onubensis TaxID=1675788 RepID=UPI0027310B00|nr:SH3 domain-containing protein [Paracoccus onubensis]MDP0928495.1 SH3 domain-containing protein [Paracoccus onubensis]
MQKQRWHVLCSRFTANISYVVLLANGELMSALRTGQTVRCKSAAAQIQWTSWSCGRPSTTESNEWNLDTQKRGQHYSEVSMGNIARLVLSVRRLHMVRQTIVAISLILLSAKVGIASPKEDCTLAVEHLGFPTSRYSFVEAGIFAKERHVFDDVINCYISPDGKIHSITRGTTVLAEDGYYGPEALAKKREIEEQGRALDAAAYKAYQDASKQIEQNTKRDLDALRRSSSPLGNISASKAPAKAQAEPSAASPEPAPVASSEPNLQPALASVKEKWSTAERLTIRTCPSTQCGVTGWITDGSKVTVYEEKSGWSRIGEPHSAMCINGKSGMVDSGNAACTPANGIVDGRLAHWVSSDYLANEKPEAPKTAQACDDLGLESSDNYRRYSNQFCTAALKMINEGACKSSDFREWGWTSSPAKGQDYYFTYCGGIQLQNRWYLNIRTGAIAH